MPASVSIKVDAHEVTEALDELTGRQTAGVLQKATKKAGNFLAGKGRSEAPPKPRKYRGTIRARNAKRDKPGTVISARHRLNAIIQGGTKDRFTKSGAFRGRIKANPWAERTADRYDDEAVRIAADELGTLLDLD